MQNIQCFLLVLLMINVPASVLADECEGSDAGDRDRAEALKFKLVAVAAILVAGGLGVSLPVAGKIFPAFKPESKLFFLIKAFAAGVILSTGFIHVLPDAFESLGSPCLPEKPWRSFPFPGLVAMLAAIAVMVGDLVAVSYHRRNNNCKSGVQKVIGDEEGGGEHRGHVHVHTHATHGHAHGSLDFPAEDSGESELTRRRVIAQVLEMGIIVHSVIIGISLGASESPSTIKPLLVALTFHQLFEGMGLGGCIAQAQYKTTRANALMVIFFALTTPIGIVVGYGISSIYHENSPTALIVEGIFNSASAGILIYMALVDLIAADFMSARMQSNPKLQIGASVSLLLGAALMSLLAIWA